jgi:phage gp45-like
MIRGIVKSVIEGVIKRFSAAGIESVADREYFQHYGYTSRPKSGAEIIWVRDGNHIIAVASDDRRYRLALEDGEVALYDDLGQVVHLTRSGIAMIAPVVTITASTKVKMDTPLVEMTGNVTVGEHVDAKSGFSGTFATKTSQVVTVQDGIIVDIS